MPRYAPKYVADLKDPCHINKAIYNLTIIILKVSFICYHEPTLHPFPHPLLLEHVTPGPSHHSGMVLEKIEGSQFHDKNIVQVFGFQYIFKS